MSDNVKLSGPIEIKDNSKQRVAFDLMLKIGHVESPGLSQKTTTIKQDRHYWLNLYSECLTTVDGKYYEIKPEEEAS